MTGVLSAKNAPVLEPLTLQRVDGIEGAEGPARFRRYSTPVGWAYSVTSILGETTSEESKARLEAWKQRPGSERYSLCRRLTGTWTHSALEHALWERLTARTEETANSRTASRFTHQPKRLPHLHQQFAAPWIQAALGWAQANVHSLLAQEQMVYHPAGFAGTLDALGWCYDTCELVLLDWKTAVKPKPLEQLEQAYLPQLAAYRAGLHHLHPDLGRIRDARCVIFLPGVQPQVVRLGEQELDHYEAVFFQRLEEFRRMVA